MIKSKYVVLACTIVLSACNFSVGTNKDFDTGLSYSYHGFAVEKVALVDPDNLPMSNNEVALDSEVIIVVDGLANYTLKNELAFPGMMLRVTDSQGNPIIDESDLFEGNNGYPPADASVLRGTITVANPMAQGQTYHVVMRVWDKNKPDTELTAEVDLVVK
jgi:hypothetical protein